MRRRDKYSQHSSIVLSVWLNGWVFVYELSGSGFESICIHLIFRFHACFWQGGPWHSGNYRVYIHFERLLDMIRTYTVIYVYVSTDNIAQSFGQFV